jgi:hypothetical protein
MILDQKVGKALGTVSAGESNHISGAAGQRVRKGQGESIT